MGGDHGALPVTLPPSQKQSHWKAKQPFQVPELAWGSSPGRNLLILFLFKTELTQASASLQKLRGNPILMKSRSQRGMEKTMLAHRGEPGGGEDQGQSWAT